MIVCVCVYLCWVCVGMRRVIIGLWGMGYRSSIWKLGLKCEK